MPGIITKRLPYTEYHLAINSSRNSEWHRELENSSSKLHYIKPHIEEWESAHSSCRQYEVKLSMINIDTLDYHMDI